ncbi:MAG: CinA family protein [Acholeplasmataceae bacterium]
MIEHVIELLKDNGLTIAFAESMTGGLLSSKMTEIAGVSKVYKGAVVAYTNDIKNRVLYIDHKDIETYGVVSSEIATKMAKSVLRLFNTDIAVGITGDAGPTLQKDSMKKMVYVAMCTKDRCETFHLSFDKESRVEAQQLTVQMTIKKLELFIPKI